MKEALAAYPWAEELEKTVVSSLATSFGLDFLLFKDKIGGDVNTVHNVRHGVWATDDEKQRYEKNEEYKGVADDYHKHANYVKAGTRDKALHKEGKLHDAYRKTAMGVGEKRNTDHVISAKEIHEDAGRVLADVSGVELANKNSNLQSTHESINKSKKQVPVEQYLERLPDLVKSHVRTLEKDKQRLAGMSRETLEQRAKARDLEEKVRKNEEKINQLQSIDVAGMRKKDAAARAAYDQQINLEYYASSKFLEPAAKASGLAGLKMGTRQMLGLVLAEIWFELRQQIPVVFRGMRHSFGFKEFMQGVKNILSGIWRRVQLRFQDFLITFKDGVFAGVFSSLTTTVFNIFATTQKNAIKIIREMWAHLVQAVKLIVFNPDQLSFVELAKAIVSILSVGVAAVTGSMVYAQLIPLCNFPFGAELASFAGALLTGLITLGLNYFLLHSGIAEKIWKFIESLGPYAELVKKFQSVNAELDRYLTDLGMLEFNMDVDDLEAFSEKLLVVNDEIQRGLVLKNEVIKRDIELPYEMGNSVSTRKWLASLVK